MLHNQRKTNPRVIDGVVQKKNNATTTGDYTVEPLSTWRFEKQRPRPGFKHVVGKQDLDLFISIIPDFAGYSVGLDAIVLTAGSASLFGLYQYGWTANGVINLCAWPAEMYMPLSDRFIETHPKLFDRLNIPFEKPEDGPAIYQFTKDTAKAFMLLDVFLHELGHHHDRVNSKRKKDCGRGEAYAEEFAREMADRIWPAYTRAFGI